MKLRPWEIRRMTMPEILLALDDDLETRRPPSYAGELIGGSEELHLAFFRGLTARQRLERARARVGYGG